MMILINDNRQIIQLNIIFNQINIYFFIGHLIQLEFVSRPLVLIYILN